MNTLINGLLDRLAFLPDWGVRGLLMRLRPSYVRHRWQLRARERADAFDLQYGTETATKLRTRRYGMSAHALRGAVMYWPTPASQFLEVLRALPQLPASMTFVDVGCGKGRTLLLSMQAGFRAVIGYEISERLAKIARNNIILAQRQLKTAQPWQVVCDDARQISLPDDDCLVYFFNPFDAITMRVVLSRMLTDRAPVKRRLLIAFLDPTVSQLELLATLSDVVEISRHIPDRGPTEAGAFAWYLFEAC